MKNPAAILSAVAGLLLTSLCCLAGIGAALYSTFLVPRAAPPPGFASAQPSTAAPGSTPSLGTTGGGGSAAPSLLLGQAQSNYGSASVSPGVDVGPMAIVSGVTRTSSVAFDGLGITPMDTGLCRGYGTAQPDIIVNVTAAVPALNFVVQANDGGSGSYDVAWGYGASNASQVNVSRSGGIDAVFVNGQFVQDPSQGVGPNSVGYGFTNNYNVLSALVQSGGTFNLDFASNADINNLVRNSGNADARASMGPGFEGNATLTVQWAAFQAIPTPGSMALLGLGGLLAARRRR